MSDVSGRARTRHALVAAARALTIAHGWDAVRMADVATVAGVSRQTVYNEFGNRTGLAAEVTATEIRIFLAGVHDELVAHRGDVRGAAHAAILRTLTEAAADPLVKAILTSGQGGAAALLPFLTTRSDLLLEAGGAVIRDWAATYLPDADPVMVALAAETAVRLTISHVMQPLDSPAASADAIAEVFTRLLT